MVNQKNLIGLGVATLAILAIAFAIQHSRKPVSDFSEQAGPLVVDIGDHINAISRFVVTSANKKVDVTLENKEGLWSVAEKGGYPADLGKLREYLLKVAEAKLIEKKTAKADRYADLGVSDISDAKAKGTQVTINGLASPVSFITGIFNAQGGGTFIRRTADKQTWLASGNLIPEKDPAQWLRKDLANIPSDRVASVTITHADGKTLRVFKDKPSAAHYTIADLPKGREPSSEFAADGLASVLADLKIDDVASSNEIPAPDKVTAIRYATFDGLIVDADAWKVGDKHYISMRASEDTDLAQKFVDAEMVKSLAATADKSNVPAEASTTDDADADASKTPATADAKPTPTPAENRDQRLAAIASEVGMLNAAFTGWSFVLPGFKIGNIDKSMEELLKPLETKPAKTKPTAKN